MKSATLQRTAQRKTDTADPRQLSVDAGEGYLVSSLDLRAGLRVQELVFGSLPVEVLLELARSRRTWPSPQPVQPSRASRSLRQ